MGRRLTCMIAVRLQRALEVSEESWDSNMRIWGYWFFPKEDWAYIVFAAFGSAAFVQWIRVVIAGELDLWTAVVAIPWVLMMCGVPAVMFRASARIRRCDRCDAEMDRVALSVSGPKQVHRCSVCGSVKATGLVWGGRMFRAGRHESSIGGELVDRAYKRRANNADEPVDDGSGRRHEQDD